MSLFAPPPPLRQCASNSEQRSEEKPPGWWVPTPRCGQVLNSKQTSLHSPTWTLGALYFAALYPWLSSCNQPPPPLPREREGRLRGTADPWHGLVTSVCAGVRPSVSRHPGRGGAGRGPGRGGAGQQLLYSVARGSRVRLQERQDTDWDRPDGREACDTAQLNAPPHLRQPGIGLDQNRRAMLAVTDYWVWTERETCHRNFNVCLPQGGI